MATTRETVICHTGEEAGAALAAGHVAWLAMECGMCRQRFAEEIHSPSDMRYHQVAEEEVVALRAVVAVVDEFAAAHTAYETMPPRPVGRLNSEVVVWEQHRLELERRCYRANRAWSALIRERAERGEGGAG